MKNATKFIVLSAPSGSGKTTIARALMQEMNSLGFAISATTRTPRAGEREGVNYYYFSLEKFQKYIKKGLFLEYEEVYPNQFYGTLKSEIQRLQKQGKYLLLDLGIQGALELKELYKNQVLTIFISVPMSDLRKRLLARGDTLTSDIEIRMKTAEEQWIKQKDAFDCAFANDKLESTVEQVRKKIANFLH